MARITVHNLDEGLKRRPRIRAAEHGKSVEQEARDILRAARDHESPQGTDLASTIRARFAPLGGVDLDLPSREPVRQPPDCD